MHILRRFLFWLVLLAVSLTKASAILPNAFDHAVATVSGTTVTWNTVCSSTYPPPFLDFQPSGLNAENYRLAGLSAATNGLTFSLGFASGGSSNLVTIPGRIAVGSLTAGGANVVVTSAQGLATGNPASLDQLRDSGITGTYFGFGGATLGEGANVFAQYQSYVAQLTPLELRGLQLSTSGGSVLNPFTINGPANVRFKTGPGGRLESSFAKINLSNLGGGTSTNASSRAFARSLGYVTDDAGHAVGQNLGGLGGSKSGNIFPQAPNVNRGDFRDFEQEIAASVRAGDEVYVRISPQYQGLATRPNSILYQVRINGQTVRVIFPNP